MPSSDPAGSSSTPDSREEIALREAWFRAQAAREFLELKKNIKLQISESEALRASLETRDTTIYHLNSARAEDRGKLNQAYKDLEEFTFLLQSAEASACTWGEVRASISWKLIRMLWSLEKAFKRRRHPAVKPVPAAHFTYYLYTPPYRIFRETRFTFHGWAVPSEVEKKITNIRVRVDDQEYIGHYGLEDNEARAHGTVVNPRPSFKIDFAIPPGKHQLALEALLGDSGWFSIFNIPIWAIPAAA